MKRLIAVFLFVAVFLTSITLIPNNQIAFAAGKKVVVIDPGHGAGGNSGYELQSPDSNITKIKDGGGTQGVATGVPEYAVTLKVANKLKALLEQNNFTVIMTKTQDSEAPGNIERAEVGNNNNADLVIRLHCDGIDNQNITGASMLVPAPVGYASSISGVSTEYGQTILDSLVASAGMNNKGVVQRSDMTGFNWSKVPVVLVEMGFMSNPQEDRLLNDDSYENKLAQGLCSGIVKCLNKTKLGWNQNNVGWWYCTDVDNGYYYTSDNGWKAINGQWYIFNASGYALENTWYTDSNGHKYYLDSDCMRVNGVKDKPRWMHINGSDYAFNEEGQLYVDCTTPDGYKVDKNGAYIIDKEK
ncbi:N-acetylmuramoyl-L-alanine amidase [Clostridium sp. YIM B02555]|uniref:N-acetylmuramoyl-L-alanine amidase family protein n=1 Tax=Clostridium sp. YIM B02555 TaxID=2911968 RepID=UPI001EED343A|nr:N-acetylmuramoyl-L-alanine amidase [Clostridium sp. YIM B02555]